VNGMKRILLLIKTLGRGGAEQLLVNAAPYLDAATFRYEVAYVLPHLDDLVDDLERRGIRTHSLGDTSGRGWASRLMSLARELKPDIVHTHSPYPAIVARFGLWGRGGQRIVHTEHNVWESYHPATRWGNMVTFPLNDHVFAVSDHVRQSIRYPRPLHFLRMPPVETLYHGLDPVSLTQGNEVDGVRESLGIPEGVPVIGSVSNFRVGKGHKYLLEAAAQVRRSFPEARIVLVGEGPLEGDLRRQVHQRGLEANVVFAGVRSDVRRLQACFDVFVLPSVHEGLSIALIEALSVGTPAVVTRTGGVTEVVSDGVNGIMVPPRDPRALGHAIISILKDPTLHQRLAKAGKIRAAAFDIRTAVRRMEAVYKELLD
jgi:glycosyltransferase involved in cell wall biosynthesis